MENSLCVITIITDVDATAVTEVTIPLTAISMDAVDAAVTTTTLAVALAMLPLHRLPV